MTTPVEADRKASLDKFIANLGQHVLEDVAGKATLAVAQTLRSDRVVERWHLALIHLKGNTPPDSDFGKKISMRIMEAQKLEGALRRKRHHEMIAKKQERVIGRKEASPVNLAQMTASLVQAQIIAGRDPDVASALATVIEIIKQVAEATKESP